MMKNGRKCLKPLLRNGIGLMNVVIRVTNRRNKLIVKQFSQLRNDFGNQCKICGTSENLEFAHIRETGLCGMGRGRKERYYDIKNNRKSYVLLCSSCHELYDDGVIDLNGNKI